jgi:hypothetical protein
MLRVREIVLVAATVGLAAGCGGSDTAGGGGGSDAGGLLRDSGMFERDMGSFGGAGGSGGTGGQVGGSGGQNGGAGVQCRLGEHCDADTGACVPDHINPCLTVHCAAGQHCDPSNGMCVDNSADACADVQCNAGSHCDAGTGRCVPDVSDACADVNCRAGQHCDPASGRCVADNNDPCSGVVCPAGQVCNPANGQCRDLAGDPCSGVVCPRGQACDPATGACAAPEDPCAAVRCRAGFECNPRTGNCDPVAAMGGGDAAPCESADDCDNGQCVSEADSQGGLPGGFCVNYCQSDDDCGAGTVCLFFAPDEPGVCFQGCGAGAVCRDGWVCDDQEQGTAPICVPDCRVAQDACAEGASCNPTTGLCENRLAMCDQVLNDGDQCDPNADCCDDGFLCVPDGPDVDGGTCRQQCDANQTPSGCGPRELCQPLEQVADPTAPAPGFCLHGDDCSPGQEVAACGEGDWSCFAYEPITLCLQAGNADVGEACDPGNDQNCRAGLVCQYGQCKQPCDARGRCPNGETCIDLTDRLDGVQFRFCQAECDPFAQQGCDAGQHCEVVDADGSAAIGGCVDGPSGRDTQGDACQEDANTYFGSCSAGHLCTPLADGEPAQCIGFCDAADQSLCTGASACVPGLLNPPFDQVGLCLGDCTVLGDQSGCGRGQYCQFIGRIGVTGDAEVPVGFCTAGDQTADTGDPCESDPDTGASNCANGNICAPVRQGDAPTCIRLCEDLPGSPYTCPRGSACQTGVFGGDDQGVGASQVIGVCL